MIHSERAFESNRKYHSIHDMKIIGANADTSSILYMIKRNISFSERLLLSPIKFEKKISGVNMPHSIQYQPRAEDIRKPILINHYKRLRSFQWANHQK